MDRRRRRRRPPLGLRRERRAAGTRGRGPHQARRGRRLGRRRRRSGHPRLRRPQRWRLRRPQPLRRTEHRCWRQRPPPGIENLRGTIHVDVLRGDGGPNRIEAIGGVDVIAGRGGVDEILAGVGDDEMEVRDGEPDTVDCGDGNDEVTADAPGVDTLTACETVERPPADPPAPGPAPAPSPAAGQPVHRRLQAPTISSQRSWIRWPSPPGDAGRAPAAPGPPRSGASAPRLLRVTAAASVAFRVTRRRGARRLPAGPTGKVQPLRPGPRQLHARRHRGPRPLPLQRPHWRAGARPGRLPAAGDAVVRRHSGSRREGGFPHGSWSRRSLSAGRRPAPAAARARARCR